MDWTIQSFKPESPKYNTFDEILEFALKEPVRSDMVERALQWQSLVHKENGPRHLLISPSVAVPFICSSRRSHKSLFSSCRTWEACEKKAVWSSSFHMATSKISRFFNMIISFIDPEKWRFSHRGFFNGSQFLCVVLHEGICSVPTKGPH